MLTSEDSLDSFSNNCDISGLVTLEFSFSLSTPLATYHGAVASFNGSVISMNQNGQRILVINGSIGGMAGNSAHLIDTLSSALASSYQLDHLSLVEAIGRVHYGNEEALVEHWEKRLAAASGVVIATGTYWDSWGSPLQRFLELMTHTEGTSLWMGKPEAVLVSMHSVGGKGVLSRLQGVLNTLGAMIPPMSGMVYSAVGHIAIEESDDELIEDVWHLDDLKLIARNLREAIEGTHRYQAWPVDRTSLNNRWIE